MDPGTEMHSVHSRLSALEVENHRLQRLVAELLIKNQELRDGDFKNKTLAV